VSPSQSLTKFLSPLSQSDSNAIIELSKSSFVTYSNTLTSLCSFCGRRPYWSLELRTWSERHPSQPWLRLDCVYALIQEAIWSKMEIGKNKENARRTHIYSDQVEWVQCNRSNAQKMTLNWRVTSPSTHGSSGTGGVLRTQLWCTRAELPQVMSTSCLKPCWQTAGSGCALARVYYDALQLRLCTVCGIQTLLHCSMNQWFVHICGVALLHCCKCRELDKHSGISGVGTSGLESISILEKFNTMRDNVSRLWQCLIFVVLRVSVTDSHLTHLIAWSQCIACW